MPGTNVFPVLCHIVFSRFPFGILRAAIDFELLDRPTNIEQEGGGVVLYPDLCVSDAPGMGVVRVKRPSGVPLRSTRLEFVREQPTIEVKVAILA